MFYQHPLYTNIANKMLHIYYQALIFLVVNNLGVLKTYLADRYYNIVI